MPLPGRAAVARPGRHWLGTALMGVGFFAIFLGAPLVRLLDSPPGAGALALLLAGVATLMLLVTRLAWFGRDVGGVPDLAVAGQLAVLIAVAAGLAVVDPAWITALALASFVVAVRCPSAVALGLVLALTALAGVLAGAGTTNGRRRSP